MTDKQDFSIEGVISVSIMFDNQSDIIIERALLRDQLQDMARKVGASQDIIDGPQRPMVEAVRRYFKE